MFNVSLKCWFSTSSMERANPHKKKRVVMRINGTKYFRVVNDVLLIVFCIRTSAKVRKKSEC